MHSGAGKDDRQNQQPKPDDWSGDRGLKWLANLSLIEQMIAPIGDSLLDRADFRQGETVIDLGCGGGATTLAIAETVAASGKVTGVDISPDLIAAARERADKGGATNVEFVHADAASVVLPEAPYDRLFSRFGSMFFPEPAKAFSHLHGLLKKGARMDLAVWGPPRDNPWMTEMMGVVRNHVEVPPAVPRAPGPFAFEDMDYLRDIMDNSGFTGLDVAAYEGLQPIGGIGATPEKAAEFALAALAIGQLLSDSDDAVRKAAKAELTEVFANNHSPDRGVLMPGKVWLVSAIA
ncbi:class I SAM-dependent methyltransferase [Parasphingorhabdus sp.]|uniref:class I SAM-dependent methyltransferase n=1 Tax=Parasphingorhabdus sp. TaxID=2709688 RepID=UPI0030019D53